ncbi:MAG: YbaK/EbsC family protein [Oscillospiraceae bacterium]|nr:YbaK/EbsC family protein [Oscillospiraceae bacterium]
MSVERAKAHLAKYGAADRVVELDSSCATVALAARAIGCEGARIAKTLSFKMSGSCILIVCAGDGRIDNKKFKARFNIKASMPSADEVSAMVGHEVGGVCPFGINAGIDVYLDESLRRFEYVYPAAGSGNSMIKLSLPELELFSGAKSWVDVCKLT